MIFGLTFHFWYLHLLIFWFAYANSAIILKISPHEDYNKFLFSLKSLSSETIKNISFPFKLVILYNKLYDHTTKSTKFYKNGFELICEWNSLQMNILYLLCFSHTNRILFEIIKYLAIIPPYLMLRLFSNELLNSHQTLTLFYSFNELE